MRWPQLIMARLPAKRKLCKRLWHAPLVKYVANFTARTCCNALKRVLKQGMLQAV
jgi:hypothetical protein